MRAAARATRFGTVFAAIADPTRRAILDALRRRERSAGQIASLFPVSRPAVSRHVRMLKPGGDFDLAPESFRSHGVRQVGMQHLEGDPALVLEVLGEIHRRHSPRAELFLDAIGAGERGAQAIPDVSQREPSLGETSG